MYSDKKDVIGLNKTYNQVKDFHRTFGHPISKNIQPARANWIEEEVEELKASLAKGNVGEIIRELADIIYLAVGGFVEIGIEPETIFNIVHKANMQKICNGDINKRGDGKVLKPKEWRDPQAAIDIITAIEMSERDKK